MMSHFTKTLELMDSYCNISLNKKKILECSVQQNPCSARFNGDSTNLTFIGGED